MNKLILTLSVFLGIGISLSSYADTVIHQDKKGGYKITVKQTSGQGFAPAHVPQGAVGFLPDGQTLDQASNKLGKVLKIGEQVIAIGEMVYDIIERGKPVTNVNYAPISVLPKVDEETLADTFYDTEGWRLPKVVEYEVVFENLFTMKVIRYQFNLIFTYGGSYQGKGQYLSGVQIVPANIEVAWGFHLNSNFRLSDIANMGSKEDPIAMANLLLEYTVRPVIPLKNIDETITFTVTGDGQVQVY